MEGSGLASASSLVLLIRLGKDHALRDHDVERETRPHIERRCHAHPASYELRRRRPELLAHRSSKDVACSRALEVLTELRDLAELDACTEYRHEQRIAEDADV